LDVYCRVEKEQRDLREYPRGACAEQFSRISLFDYLRMRGSADRQELESLILDKLSDVLGDQQRANKFRNPLYTMANRDKTIVKTGGKQKGHWVLRSAEKDPF
jgi:hypothetical protein